MTSISRTLLLAAVLAGWAARGGQAQEQIEMLPPAPDAWRQRIEALNVVEPRWQALNLANQRLFTNQHDPDQLRAAMRRALDLRIDELRRVCGLSQPQLKKLQVAAKGARERAIEKASPVQFAPSISVQAHAVGGNVDVQQQAAVIVAQAGNNQVVRVWNQGAEIVHVGPGLDLTATAEKVIGEPIWKDTVQRLLDYEQKRHFAAALSARAAFRRQAADVFDKLLARLDELLLLDADQRQPLKKTIMQQQHAANAKFAENALFIEMQLGQIVQQIPAADIEQILTPAQLAVWKELPQQLAFQPARLQWGAAPRQVEPGVPILQLEVEAQEVRP